MAVQQAPRDALVVNMVAQLEARIRTLEHASELTMFLRRDKPICQKLTQTAIEYDRAVKELPEGNKGAFGAVCIFKSSASQSSSCSTHRQRTNPST